MSRVIEERSLKEDFLEDLDDCDIELFPMLTEKVSLDEGVEPIENFFLDYRKKRIGFMMVIPKDKLSDRESVEIYLNPAATLTAVEILEVLQDEYLPILEITLDWLRR